jgi:hypothetical protein
MFGFNALGKLLPDGPTSIFSTSLNHPALWIFKEMPHEYRVDQYTPGFQNCIYASNAHIK